MRVTLSVMGRFHAFNLAQQLQRAGFLERLITTYPKFVAAKYGLPKSGMRSFWPLEIISRIWERSPQWITKNIEPQIATRRIFDCLAARSIPQETDIFVGWSSVCLESLQKAKQQGTLAVVDEGSSHVLSQTEILKQEYERHGLTPRLPHPRIIEQELREYEEADYIVVPSSFVKRSFLQRGFREEKLLQAHYGADPVQFKSLPKKDDVFRVIHCGALSLRKGAQYLLQAFYELRLPNAELWLIGILSQEIVSFLKKYDDGRVFHKGPYPQAELYKYYSQGSVFCLASVEEGFAMVIPQAMACGLPVIATTNTGAEEVIQNGKQGYIIPIRDVEALKERLLILYENPKKRAEMGEAAKRASLQCTWDAYGQRIISKYQEILRLSRRPQ